MAEELHIERRSTDEALLDRIYIELQSIHVAISTLSQNMAITQTTQAHYEKGVLGLSTRIDVVSTSVDKYKADRSFIIGLCAALAIFQGVAAYVVTNWLDNIKESFHSLSIETRELRVDLRKVQDAQLSIFGTDKRPR